MLDRNTSARLPLFHGDKFGWKCQNYSLIHFHQRDYWYLSPPARMLLFGHAHQMLFVSSFLGTDILAYWNINTHSRLRERWHSCGPLRMLTSIDWCLWGCWHKGIFNLIVVLNQVFKYHRIYDCLLHLRHSKNDYIHILTKELKDETDGNSLIMALLKSHSDFKTLTVGMILS